MVVESEESENYYAIECPVLVTERLVLRPPHVDDVPELAELANNRQIAEMLAHLPFPYTEADAEQFVNDTPLRVRPGCSYAIALAETGAFIGCAGIHPEQGGHPKQGELELGYWIGERYWGNGYATEVAQALVDLAFRVTEIKKMYASCRVINDASRRVIHKCGFQYAGQSTLDSRAAGNVPVELYQLDRKTWVSLRSWGVGR